MKMKEFIREKKWHFISGVSFLVAFAIVVGVFINLIYIKLDSVQKQNDMFLYTAKSLEASSAALKSSIDGMAQNAGSDSDYQLLAESLKADLVSVNSKLSKFADTQSNINDISLLKASIDQLNKKLNGINNGTTPVKPAAKETAAIPEKNIPGSPAKPLKPRSGIIKKGQEITVNIRAGAVTDLYGYQLNLSFDKSKVSYKSGLKSSINGISMIFKKDFPDYLLIGATMTGNKPGYSGKNVNVCTLVFTAIEDADLSVFKVNNVGTVDSAQKYVQNINGWSCEATVG